MRLIVGVGGDPRRERGHDQHDENDDGPDESQGLFAVQTNDERPSARRRESPTGVLSSRADIDLFSRGHGLRVPDPRIEVRVRHVNEQVDQHGACREEQHDRLGWDIVTDLERTQQVQTHPR